MMKKKWIQRHLRTFKEDNVEKKKSHKPVGKEKALNLVVPAGEEMVHNVVSPQPETEIEVDLCKIMKIDSTCPTKTSNLEKGSETEIEIVMISPKSELKEIAKDGTSFSFPIFNLNSITCGFEDFPKIIMSIGTFL